MSKSVRDTVLHANRRDVLKAGGALTIAMWLPACDAPTGPKPAATDAALEPNAFVRIGADDSITVYSKHLEMGQGTYTGLATLVAEELDADWKQVRVEGAPADVRRYANLSWVKFQGTGGSNAIANSYEQLRKAGATARLLLVAAAAQRWGVSATEITTAAGTVTHRASGKSARFGELVADASRLPIPTDVTLKDPADFTLIGRPAARVDSVAKSTGTATFTQDVKLPGMLTAVVAHPPRFGARVRSFDATSAQEIKGVKSVVAFATPARSGVAVLASDFWSAKKGRDALRIEWDESGAFRGSSDDMLAQYRALAQTPGEVAKSEGNVSDALANATRTIEAVYEFPYLAHAAMEPMNCVVRIGAQECEIWNGEQFQTIDQEAVAKFLGLPPEKVVIHQVYAGGSFGRRANPASDYIVESVAIAKAAAVSVPVKLVWTREEDTRAGYYRPMFVHALKAGIDRAGSIVAWRQRIVGQPLFEGTPFMGNRKICPTMTEGAVNLPYHIPNLQVEVHTVRPQVPVQWWRSVGSTHTAFAAECFLDDIARHTRQDPCEMRRRLLSQHPRHLAVLDLVADKAGWNKQRAADETYGLALHESFGTVVGQVVKLKRTADGPKLVSVVCAVDCGVVINPNIVEMQMESGIGYGLSAAINGAITFRDGKVEQSNFDDYPVLRINEMPAISVHIVSSKNKPSGVGEPSTPVIAPALANALAVMNGKPVRSLPLSMQGIRLA